MPASTSSHPQIQMRFGGLPIIPVLKLDDGTEVPRGEWDQYTHFDGSLYWHSATQKILTRNDITQRRTYDAVRAAAADIVGKAERACAYKKFMGVEGSECLLGTEFLVVGPLPPAATPAAPPNGAGPSSPNGGSVASSSAIPVSHSGATPALPSSVGAPAPPTPVFAFPTPHTPVLAFPTPHTPVPAFPTPMVASSTIPDPADTSDPAALPDMFFLEPRLGKLIRPTFRPAPAGTIIHRLTMETEVKTEAYWRVLEEFPMHFRGALPGLIEADFLGALTYGTSERILEWKQTPFPFSDAQTQRLLKVYRDLADAARDPAVRPNVQPAMIWHIARTMLKIEGARRRAGHGTAQSALYRPVAVGPAGLSVKALDMLLAVVLFGVQRMYRLRLEGERVQGVIYAPNMRGLFGQFLAEWTDTNLLATVLVGSNIAFLAVPNVNTLQQTASLASSLFAMLSVLSGLHHAWQHRAGVDASDDEVRVYLNRFRFLGASRDLAVVACFLSIPVAALLWSILCFTAALGAFCVQNVEGAARGLLTAVLGILMFIGLATMGFFWHIWRGPRREEISEEDGRQAVRGGWKEALERHRAEWRDIFGKTAVGRRVLGRRPPPFRRPTLEAAGAS